MSRGIACLLKLVSHEHQAFPNKPPYAHPYGGLFYTGGMTENDLYEQVAQYLNLKHPHLIYHYDLSGMWTSSHKARNLYGRLNQRAFPDLVLYHPSADGQYAGLALELKVAGTVIYKKDGSLRAGTHLAEQEAMLIGLRAAGYRAEFACGLTEAITIIEDYLQHSTA